LENVKLDEVLLNVISKLSQKADSKNIKIELEKLDIIEIKTNKFLVQTIFINIIDNAIKYSKEKGGKILISLFKEDNNVVFKVKDNGIGINENEIENLTERFYRVDKARNRGIKGFGLGLSIVQKALEILDGEIQFLSEENKGTEVIVKFKGLKNV
jgi:signal transduction histidine kinase